MGTAAASWTTSYVAEHSSSPRYSVSSRYPSSIGGKDDLAACSRCSAGGFPMETMTGVSDSEAVGGITSSLSLSSNNTTRLTLVRPVGRSPACGALRCEGLVVQNLVLLRSDVRGTRRHLPVLLEEQLRM
ncbi:unnamed protein product [Lampetra planeri]